MAPILRPAENVTLWDTVRDLDMVIPLPSVPPLLSWI